MIHCSMNQFGGNVLAGSLQLVAQFMEFICMVTVVIQHISHQRTCLIQAVKTRNLAMAMRMAVGMTMSMSMCVVVRMTMGMAMGVAVRMGMGMHRSVCVAMLMAVLMFMGVGMFAAGCAAVAGFMLMGVVAAMLMQLFVFVFMFMHHGDRSFHRCAVLCFFVCTYIVYFSMCTAKKQYTHIFLVMQKRSAAINSTLRQTFITQVFP